MVLILLMWCSTIVGKLVFLFEDSNFSLPSSWTSDCPAKYDIPSINATTRWHNIQPNDPAMSSYSLIAATCTITNSAPVTQYTTLNDCMIVLEIASTDPTAFSGSVQWQGKSIQLDPPDSIYSNASVEISYVKWSTNIGSFTADNDTFVIMFTVGTLASTRWLVTNSIQVQCDVPWLTNENLVMILSATVGFMLLILIIVVCLVRRCVLNERKYFALNSNRKRKCTFC